MNYLACENSCITSSVALEELCQVCENNADDVTVMSPGLSLLEFIKGSQRYNLDAWSLKEIDFYKTGRV